MSTEEGHPAFPALDCARHLQRCGQWDLALAAIRDLPGGQAALARAEILVDRHAWRLGPPEEALSAVRAIESEHPLHAAFLSAQLAYWQELFDLGGAPIRSDVVAAFDELADESVLRSWPVFFRSVALQYLRRDVDSAGEGFSRVLRAARTADDSFLESYVLRHQAELLPTAENDRAVELLRCSLNMRAAIGARPHCAASQAMLAVALGDCAEAEDLRRLSADTAAQLGLTWLLSTAGAP